MTRTAPRILRGSHAQYKHLKPIDSGARGQIFLASIDRKVRRHHPTIPLPAWFRAGASVVVKTVNIARDDDADGDQVRDRIIDVNRTLQIEISVQSQLNELQCVAQIVDWGLWGSGTVRRSGVVIPMFIVQEYVKGESLSTFLKRRWPSPRKNFEGIPDASHWLDLAIGMAKALNRIHGRAVIHRDIWPPNIMIRDDLPVLVDFGESAFRRVTRVAKSELSVLPHAYMAPEQRGAHPWPSRRSDLYSLGGVLFYMATGEDPRLEPFEHDDDLKGFVFGRILTKNPSLLDASWGIADVISRCLRMGRDRRIRNTAALLQDLRLFRQNDQAPAPAELLKSIAEHLDKLTAQGDGLFTRMAEAKLEAVADEIRDMSEGLMDIVGDHEAIVHGFTRYLSVLRAGDEYSVVSVPNCWRATNLGINGRFLSMNRELAARDVKIRRVLLLTDQDRSDQEIAEIVRAQLKIQESLPLVRRANMDARFIIVSEAERVAAVNSGAHKGVWRSGHEYMSGIPVYDAGGRIQSVRLRTATSATLEPWFTTYFNRARPLREWLPES